MKVGRLVNRIVLASAMSIATAQAAEVGVSATEIRIGEILPLTGPASFAGEAHYLGTKIALAEANAAGGIGGRKIVAVTEDDGYVPARSFQAAQKLVTSDSIFALTGTSGTSHLLAMMPLLMEKEVLTIVSINPNEQAYEPPKKNIFVVGTSYGNAIYAIMKHAIEKMGKKDGRFAIIYQEDDYGANVKLGYDRAVKEFGLKSVSAIPYKRGQKDFSAEMLKVANEKVDFLISGGIISENVAVLREARKLGLTDLSVGTVWTAHLPAVQKLAAEAGDGYLTADYTATMSEAAAEPFINLAKKHLTPDEVKKVNRYTMTAYAGANVLIQAMTACEKDLTRACVVKELESGRKFDVGAIMAPVSFSPTRRFSDSAVRVLRSEASSDRFVPVTTF